jgi:hypothetical protein
LSPFETFRTLEHGARGSCLPIAVEEHVVPASPFKDQSTSAPVYDVSPQPRWLGEHEIDAVLGDGSGTTASWKVQVYPTPTGVGIGRHVLVNDSKGRPADGWLEWEPENRWRSEPVIWPSWTVGAAEGEPARGGTALDSVHESWRNSSDRIRESAKWMATVIGVAIAALVGTSPLAMLSERPFTPLGWGFALLGLGLLATTILLILRVLRPSDTSYIDVQTAALPEQPVSADSPARSGRRRTYLPRDPLSQWREIVETQQDLWLPSGVKCLTTLRQAMIVDELTLMALSCVAAETGVSAGDISPLREAQAVRVARLHEFRQAAARIVEIGEFYRLRRRNDWATYLGGAMGVAGTTMIIVAFALPQ